jgi:SAM-dependent methyltransferase
MSSTTPNELARVYANRFDADRDYRAKVWRVLAASFFQRWIPENGAVLDLGCGYGEFINTIKAKAKFGMDLNPTSREHLSPEVKLLAQDCSAPWALPAEQLDVVFTSNFFEHLPDKSALGRTLDEAFRCLKSGGRLIALGPNIKFTRGAYWDFWDHYLPLTEASLSEGMRVRGFHIDTCHARFLPYKMAGGPKYPLWMLEVYLRLPLLWRLRGQQFLVIGRKPEGPPTVEHRTPR